MPYLQHWSLYYPSHQNNPHSFFVSFCHRTNCSQFSGLKSPPFLLRSQCSSINQWPAGRWAGDQVILDGPLHVPAGWQLSAWVSHSPQGGLSSPSRLSGSPLCCSRLQGHQERTVHYIQVSSCVMCDNVLLAKASPLAKLAVCVGTTKASRWLLEPFFVRSLPRPSFFLPYHFGRRNRSPYTVKQTLLSPPSSHLSLPVNVKLYCPRLHPNSISSQFPWNWFLLLSLY